MKKIILILSVMMMSVGTFSQDMPGMKMPSQTKATGTTTKVIYTCPMHPEVQKDKPGSCPKCGMTLEKKTVKVKAPKPVAKKPMVTKPAAKDTSAKMEMPDAKQGEKMQDMDGMNMPKATDKSAEAPASYTCPMHSDIHSSKPGNCPKCGMKLVKEKPKATGQENHDGMKMNGDSSKAHDMHNMNGMQMGRTDMPKVDFGPINTIPNNMPPRTVVYHLYIRDTVVNFTGKSKRAIAVNGQIPMPTLTFTEGDTAEIWVHNELKEETSLHWHGLFVPNRYDGVPFMTQMPIKPGGTYLYKFPIIQHGTHWYHSHSGLQEQIGMYGMFVMNKRAEWDIPTVPVMLSDWTDMNPKEVNRSLHNQTDWFGIRKNTVQSYSEAIRSGHFKTKVTNEWKRMTAMDVSDIAYDKFLVNGRNEATWNPPPGGRGAAGQKVRLRIANGGASSYFWLSYAGGKITVVATDGNDVEPVEVDRLIIAVSETYDVVVTIPDNKSYEFLVTPEDRTKAASLWLGSGEKVHALKLSKLKYFAGMKMMNDMMDMKGNMIEMEGMEMANQIMDMNTVMYPEITGVEKKTDTLAGLQQEMPSGYTTKMKAANNKPTGKGHNMAGMYMDDSKDIVTLNYTMLRAPQKTALPPGPLKTLRFDLTGNMNRYVWSLDNKVVSESDKILIKKGENVRIIMFNNSMMRHPMHLHGHDFRLLNGQGEHAIMKNIIDIMPMERDTIEFAATESGDWFFHCHILYHMMSGMGRVFSYADAPADTDIKSTKVAKRGLNSDDRMFHFMARVGLESNGSDGEAMLAQTRWKASTLWHLGLHDMHGYESETMIGRYLGRMQWWYPYVGFDYHYKKPEMMDVNGVKVPVMEKNLFGQVSNKNNRKTVVAGIAYTMPMLVVADGRIDGNGKLRFQLSREDIPVTPKLRLNWMANTDKEYMAVFRYILNKYVSLSTHYDSDMGLGGGITITY